VNPSITSLPRHYDNLAASNDFDAIIMLEKTCDITRMEGGGELLAFKAI
jgi:hypothetical protein